MKKIEATVEKKAHKAEQATCSGNDGPTPPTDSKRKSKAKLKKEKKKEENKWCDPDDIPVVVLDGFMSREKGPHARELWTFLAEWAAILAENHIAHVVFISNNVAASKPLSRGMFLLLMKLRLNIYVAGYLIDQFPSWFSIALPNMTFETIVLSDATLESAMEFVNKNLDHEDYPDLIEPVKVIGGRLTDLEMFVQKVKSGMEPNGKPVHRCSMWL